MARLETWYKQDLKRPLVVHKHTDVFNQDSKGNLIGVEVYSDGEPVVLAGSISGYCLLADGTTVPAVGASRSGNKASVLIPQTAYSVPGPITITIKNVEGDNITTLCATVGVVRQSVSGNLVNPGSVVTDWSNNINAQLQAVQTAADNVGAIVAAPFDENTVYVAGNYVTNNGNLYRITADHAAGVAWSGTEKMQCTVGHELEALNKHFIANWNLIDPDAASGNETGFIPVELNVRYNIIHAQSKGQFRYGLSLYDSNKTMLYISQLVDEATDGTNYSYSCTFSESAIAYVKLKINSAPSGIDTTDFSKVYFGKGSEYIEFDDYNVINAIKKVKDDVSDLADEISDTQSDVSDLRSTLGTVPSGKTAQGQIDDNSNDIYDLKSAFELYDQGKRVVKIDMDWAVGGIDNTGKIDSGTSFWHTRKIYSNEINGGVITSNPGYTLYAYRYRADGSYVYGYLTIGKVSTFNVPSDYLNDGWSMRLVTSVNGYSAVSAIGYEATAMQEQIDALAAESAEVPKVVMLDKLVALVDEQFDIHYDNIFVNYRAKDIPYIELFGNVHGIGMESLARLQHNTAENGITGSIRYRNSITGAYNSPNLPDNVLRKAFSVDTIPISAGSGTTRKVLLIGDSWTAPGKYARELRTLFESVDEPMNITLLGTLGNGGAYVGPENGYHEGHGAFSAKTYCTKSTYNGYANAFYNPTTETFDFTYYMNNCGYSSVDDVFINLGINDVAEIQDFDEIISYWDIMINSIKTYNSNIKVFIGLCGLPAQYKYGTTNNNCNRSKARRLLFHEKLIEEYGNNESNGIIIVPLHLSIDSEHDFPTTQMARSYCDSTLVDYCTDYVHPNDIAYNKIADRIRTYIKYAETLS